MTQRLRGTFSFKKRTFAHRRGDTIPSHFVAANRAASSKQACFFCRWQRFACFPTPPNEKPGGIPKSCPPSRRYDSRPLFVAANRAASSKSPRFIRHWRRFGDFPPDPLKTARPRGPAGPLILDFIPRDMQTRRFAPLCAGVAAAGPEVQIDLNHHKNCRSSTCGDRVVQSVWYSAPGRGLTEDRKQF